MIAERNRSMAKQIAKAPQKICWSLRFEGLLHFRSRPAARLHDTALPEVEFITLSSYGAGTVSQGVRIVKDIDSSVKDRDVLLIDDILESGRTLLFAKELLYERGARNVTIAVLLDKRQAQEKLEADYVGFECPDYFVVGYGMDVAYAFRELPLSASSRATLNRTLPRKRHGALTITTPCRQIFTPRKEKQVIWVPN